jgi:hypothetical protein
MDSRWLVWQHAEFRPNSVAESPKPVLLSTLIRVLLENKSTWKHTITPRYEASDIQTVGYELEKPIGTRCRNSTKPLVKNNMAG